MKKVILLVSGLIIATLANAGTSGVKGLNGLSSLHGGPGINNGFYLHLGFAFPSMKAKTVDGKSVSGSESQSLGFQPSLEFGNQWYFYKNDQFGIGLRVSWLQFGYSTAKIKGTSDGKVSTLDFRFLKVAPQATFGLGDDMALDVSVEFAPTVMVSGYKYSSYNAGQLGVGLLIAPGARFRIKKFAVGVDCGFGSVSGAFLADVDGAESYIVKSAIIIPRLYLGFKF